jgi:RNA polymerase sigma factor (sigma-70 family)
VFEIELKTSAKNGVIVKFLKEMRWSQTMLATALDISLTTVNAYINLRKAPKTPRMIKLFEALFAMPIEDIFPDVLNSKRFLTAAKKMNLHTQYISLEEYMTPYQIDRFPVESISSEDRFIQTELIDLIQKHMKKLSKKKQMVMNMRYGLSGCSEYSLEDIGKLIGVTRVRVMQIEQESLEFLKKRSIMEITR